MSQPKSQVAVGDAFAEDGIADYLRSHPDFFERHPLLLLGLRLPHRSGGSTISLVERQVAMLRQRNGQLERQLKDLVAVAKQNDALVEKLHRLAMNLVRARSPAETLERIEASLREDFLAERAQLVLFPEADPALARDGFVQRLDPLGMEVRPFAAFLRSGRPRCGLLRDRQKELFGREADSVSSAAMLPLGPMTEAGHPAGGFLVIGSRDPEHFHPGKRMDFLTRLGELITVALFPERPGP